MNDDQARRSFLKAHLEAGRHEIAWHPSAEELEAFEATTLPPDQEQRVRGHLPLCPDCAEAVLAMGEMRELGSPPSGEMSPKEVDGAWDRFEQTLRQQRPEPRPARIRWLRLLAAVLALAAVGLSLGSVLLWRENRRLAERSRASGMAVAELSKRLDSEKRRGTDLVARTERQNRRIAALGRQLADAFRPRINTPVLDLSPRGPRGAGPAAPIPEVLRGAELFTLFLEPEDRRTYPAYRVEVLAAEGRILWKLEGLTKTEFGNFTLILARQGLPAGEIRLRIFGVKGGRETEVGEYALHIQ